MKDESKIKSVKIFCSNLNKDVNVTEYSFSASESECETCGSHGNIMVYVNKCKCGKTHSIEIDSW